MPDSADAVSNLIASLSGISMRPDSARAPRLYMAVGSPASDALLSSVSARSISLSMSMDPSIDWA